MAGHNNGNAMSLKGIFQGMIPADAEIMQGTVISTNPLRIQMTNNEKLIINQRITIIPRHLSNYTAACALSDYSGKITIYNALRTGEKVYILSLNNGKLYYVLDRVVS